MYAAMTRRVQSPPADSVRRAACRAGPMHGRIGPARQRHPPPHSLLRVRRPRRPAGSLLRHGATARHPPSDAWSDPASPFLSGPAGHVRLGRPSPALPHGSSLPVRPPPSAVRPAWACRPAASRRRVLRASPPAGPPARPRRRPARPITRLSGRRRGPRRRGHSHVTCRPGRPGAVAQPRVAGPGRLPKVARAGPKPQRRGDPLHAIAGVAERHTRGPGPWPGPAASEYPALRSALRAR